MKFLGISSTKHLVNYLPATINKSTTNILYRLQDNRSLLRGNNDNHNYCDLTVFISIWYILEKQKGAITHGLQGGKYLFHTAGSKCVIKFKSLCIISIISTIGA